VTHVSVIVPARNAEVTLPRTLAALRAQEGAPEFEVIVVDDGSTDATARVAEAGGPPVRVLSQAAAGPAEARNRGVAAASGEVLAFCDADCFPARGWLAAGVRALGHADLVQGQVRPDPAAELGPFDRSLWITYEVGLWETANLFVTRELYDRTGGFEDWLRPVAGKAMAEDVWFGWRAKRAGGRSAFCAEALAHHAVFPRGARDYVMERRRLRHFPEMAAKMPELRDAFLHRRWFLNHRTLALDLALAGTAAALVARTPLPLAAWIPYFRGARRPTRVAAVDLAADLVGAWALARGSARARSIVA
jgi:glycosyltransferase involved in cell wall biosynthesis